MCTSHVVIYFKITLVHQGSDQDVRLSSSPSSSHFLRLPVGGARPAPLTRRQPQRASRKNSLQLAALMRAMMCAVLCAMMCEVLRSSHCRSPPLVTSDELHAV